MRKVVFIVFSLLLLTTVSAQVQIIGQPINRTINIVAPGAGTFNNATGQVNASEYWITENGSLDTIGQLISSTQGGLDNRYLRKNGDRGVGAYNFAHNADSPITINRTAVTGAVDKWLSFVLSGGTELFWIGTFFTQPGVIAGTDQAFCFSSDDVNQRYCIYDTTASGANSGAMDYVANSFIRFYTGDLFAETIKFSVNRTGVSSTIPFHASDNIFASNNITILNTDGNIKSKGVISLSPWDSPTSTRRLEITNTSSELTITGIGVSTFRITDNLNFTEGGVRNITGLNLLETQNLTVKREFKTGVLALDTIYQNNRSREINVHAIVQASTFQNSDVAYVECYVGKPLNYSTIFIQSGFGIIIESAPDDSASRTIEGDLDFFVPVSNFYSCNTTISGGGTVSLVNSWKIDD